MRFTLVRHRSRSFRYYMCDLGPFRPTFLTRGLRMIRFLYGYVDDPLSQLATHVNSLAHGSRRMKQRWSAKLVGAVTRFHFAQHRSFLSASFTHCLVSSTFHSLSRVLFIFRSRYYIRYRSSLIFRFAGRNPASSHGTTKSCYSGYSIKAFRITITGLSPSMAQLSRSFHLLLRSLIRVHTPHLHGVFHRGFSLTYSVFARR